MGVIKIGSDEFTGSKTYQFEEDVQIDPEKEEKILNEFKPIYIPERRIPEFLKGYDCVVVNEFGDDYHQSEEEREKNNKFYKTFREFAVTAKRYRNVVEYVKVMRMALKCLNAVAEDNGVYPPDKFKKMFLEDKSKINGLRLPELKGRESKSIDWKYLAEFIISDEPAENISSKKEDIVYSEDELEDLADVMFDEGELDEMLAPETDEEKKLQTMDLDPDSEEFQQRFPALVLSNKEMKKLAKVMPELVYGVKEIKRDTTKINNMSRFVYDLTADDLSEIERYDQRYAYQSTGDMPKFKGDIMNDDDYNRYMAELDEYEETQIREMYNGKFKTKEQINELQIKTFMEANGYNLRNLYGNKDKEKKLKRLQKRDKEREKKLKARLIKLKNRNKRRMGEDVETSSKKSKKKKKKNKKNKPVKSKEVKRVEAEMNDAMEEFLLASADRLENNFKDYKRDATDFTWDSVFGKDEK